MRRKLTALTITLAGGALVTAGVAQIYPPAALIVGGVLLVALGLFVIDVER